MVVGYVGTGYVLRVELPVQRRLCSIFVRDVGSPDIHECFHGLTGSQRTIGIWGVTFMLYGFIELDTISIYTNTSPFVIDSSSNDSLVHDVK